MRQLGSVRQALRRISRQSATAARRLTTAVPIRFYSANASLQYTTPSPQLVTSTSTPTSTPTPTPTSTIQEASPDTRHQPRLDIADRLFSIASGIEQCFRQPSPEIDSIYQLIEQMITTASTAAQPVKLHPKVLRQFSYGLNLLGRYQCLDQPSAFRYLSCILNLIIAESHQHIHQRTLTTASARDSSQYGPGHVPLFGKMCSSQECINRFMYTNRDLLLSDSTLPLDDRIATFLRTLSEYRPQTSYNDDFTVTVRGLIRASAAAWTVDCTEAMFIQFRELNPNDARFVSQISAAMLQVYSKKRMLDHFDRLFNDVADMFHEEHSDHRRNPGLPMLLYRILLKHYCRNPRLHHRIPDLLSEIQSTGHTITSDIADMLMRAALSGGPVAAFEQALALGAELDIDAYLTFAEVLANRNRLADVQRIKQFIHTKFANESDNSNNNNNNGNNNSGDARTQRNWPPLVQARMLAAEMKAASNSNTPMMAIDIFRRDVLPAGRAVISRIHVTIAITTLIRYPESNSIQSAIALIQQMRPLSGAALRYITPDSRMLNSILGSLIARQKMLQQHNGNEEAARLSSSSSLSVSDGAEVMHALQAVCEERGIRIRPTINTLTVQLKLFGLKFFSRGHPLNSASSQIVQNIQSLVDIIRRDALQPDIAFVNTLIMATAEASRSQDITGIVYIWSLFDPSTDTGSVLRYLQPGMDTVTSTIDALIHLRSPSQILQFWSRLNQQYPCADILSIDSATRLFRTISRLPGSLAMFPDILRDCHARRMLDGGGGETDTAVFLARVIALANMHPDHAKQMLSTETRLANMGRFVKGIDPDNTIDDKAVKVTQCIAELWPTVKISESIQAIAYEELQSPRRH
ncbi:hypothetical protein GQ42DRAFT_162950 [Ramicandelaber brevisporus]|nr:hypothetical protein GQ42DRAFT_162950 [Ramicandelaber brevisporus]